MRRYLMRHGAVVATVGVAGSFALVILGAAWGIGMLNVYALLWSPYVDAYRVAAGMGDPMLLGGRVSVGAAAFHCEAMVIMMAPWALVAAQCFFRFVGLVDDFFAYSLNGGSRSKASVILERY
jgi:hypothetical protein